jgi:hypothetical protein
MARMTRAEMQDPAYQEHIRKLRAEAGTEGRVRRAGEHVAIARAPGQPQPPRETHVQPRPEASIGAANPFVPRVISVEDMRVFASQLETMVGTVSGGASDALRELAGRIESLEALMAGVRKRTEALQAGMAEYVGGAESETAEAAPVGVEESPDLPEASEEAA